MPYGNESTKDIGTVSGVSIAQAVSSEVIEEVNPELVR